MAGTIKLDGTQFLEKVNNEFKITNSELKLKSTGNTIVDSSGNAVVSESGGIVNLGSVVQTIPIPNWYLAEQQITGGNAVSVGFYAGSATASERRTVNIPAMQLRINTKVYTLSSSSTLDANTAGSWASNETSKATAASRNGEDVYVYAVEPASGTTPNFCLSANSTHPSGTVGGVTASATNSRKIGGFHCLCANVGTISGHFLTGYLEGDILPRSVWTQAQHRPESNPEGMVYAGNRLWVDIYLATTVNSQLVSVYDAYPQVGGTAAQYPNSPTPYYHWYNFVERFAEVNKRLPVQSEFMRFALGSNEETNITGNSFPDKTTGGNIITTESRRMISDFGVEDCAGALWQWSNETGSDGAIASWVEQDTAGTANSLDNQLSIGRGKAFAVPNRGILGGSWGSAEICGSRGIAWAYSPLLLVEFIGARGVSESKF